MKGLSAFCHYQTPVYLGLLVCHFLSKRINFCIHSNNTFSHSNTYSNTYSDTYSDTSLNSCIFSIVYQYFILFFLLFSCFLTIWNLNKKEKKIGFQIGKFFCTGKNYEGYISVSRIVE